MPAVDQDLIAPHYSNRLLQGLLVHLEEEHGAELLEQVLEDAGLPRAHLDDREGWVSMSYVSRLVRSVARRLHQLGEPPPHDHPMWQHWRAAGRANVRPGLVGALFGVIRALGTPNNLYRALPSFAERGNRLLELKLESARGGRAVLTARPTVEGGWTSANCWLLLGMLEAGPTIWGLPRARVVHPECMHDPHRPAERCRYMVSYESRRWSRILGMVAAGGLGAGVASLLDIMLEGGVTPMVAVAGASTVVAVEGWRRYIRSARSSRRDIEQLGHLIEEADQRYARLWEDERELRRSLLTATKLAGYLAPDLVERVVEDPEIELTLGGRLTRAAVLFADIVGYTHRSEGRPPEDVVEELNLYFSFVDPVFERYDGVIDKRMGDGVMVVFVPRADEPEDGVDRRAILCALDMLRALVPCNRELAAMDSPELAIRIGIAAGQLIQGNMGSPLKLEYTVIGDVVNVASRLEGKATHDRALVAAEMIAALTEEERSRILIDEPHRIQVKGRSEAVEVVELAPILEAEP